MEVFLYITCNEQRVREGSLLNGLAWGKRGDTKYSEVIVHVSALSILRIILSLMMPLC